MSVQFLQKYGAYNEGEVATFTPDREKDLLRRKIAHSVVVPPRKKAGEEDDVNKDNSGKKNPSDPQNRQTTGTSSGKPVTK